MPHHRHQLRNSGRNLRVYECTNSAHKTSNRLGKAKLLSTSTPIVPIKLPAGVVVAGAAIGRAAPAVAVAGTAIGNRCIVELGRSLMQA